MARNSRNDNPYYLARINAKLSVEEVAELTKYDKSTIYKIERGDFNPKTDYVGAFSSSGNVPASELPVSEANGLFKYNAYAETIILKIRESIRAQPVALLTLPKKRKDVPDYPDETALHEGILHLLSEEATHPEAAVQFVWTGRNYEEFSTFYTDLYDKYIPAAIASGVNILHLLRDGISTQEKLGIVSFILPKVLRIRDHLKYSIRVVRNMYIQSYVNDIYNSDHSGSILCFTTSTFGEPSQGLFSPRRKEITGKYLSFVKHNSEERVLFLPQERRKEFFAQYLTTESRTGEWVMLQKLPANSTRPISDYGDDTRWARRMKAIEKARRGPGIEEVIQLRRTAANFFRDRLSNGRFRQIMSRQTVQRWIKTGENPDLAGRNLDRDLLDHPDEIKNRLKNLISLMDDTNGNFQLALADEPEFERLGWSEDSFQSIAWVVQGLEGTVFEGHEERVGKPPAEYNIMVRDAEFSKIFARTFTEAWRSLPRRDTDQASVRQFLVSMLREVE